MRTSTQNVESPTQQYKCVYTHMNGTDRKSTVMITIGFHTGMLINTRHFCFVIFNFVKAVALFRKWIYFNLWCSVNSHTIILHISVQLVEKSRKQKFGMFRIDWPRNREKKTIDNKTQRRKSIHLYLYLIDLMNIIQFLERVLARIGLHRAFKMFLLESCLGRYMIILFERRETI